MKLGPETVTILKNQVAIMQALCFLVRDKRLVERAEKTLVILVRDDEEKAEDYRLTPTPPMIHLAVTRNSGMS